VKFYAIEMPIGGQMAHTKSLTEAEAWEKFAQGGDVDLFQSLAEQAGYRVKPYEPLENEYA